MGGGGGTRVSFSHYDEENFLEKGDGANVRTLDTKKNKENKGVG